ncbi:hypothetical protein ACJX0J_019718, partial [Zea mays]
DPAGPASAAAYPRALRNRYQQRQHPNARPIASRSSTRRLELLDTSCFKNPAGPDRRVHHQLREGGRVRHAGAVGVPRHTAVVREARRRVPLVPGRARLESRRACQIRRDARPSP